MGWHEPDPATPVAQVGERKRRELVDTAATMLSKNLGSGPRVTAVVNGRPGLAVYGRAGLPCIRCGGPVRSGTHGIHARSTYWCPVCQPPFGVAAPGLK